MLRTVSAGSSGFVLENTDCGSMPNDDLHVLMAHDVTVLSGFIRVEHTEAQSVEGYVTYIRT
jgi:hypothetical protein